MQEMDEQAPRSKWIEGRQAMLKLASLGWVAKRNSLELSCSRNTVRSYLCQVGWQPYQSIQGVGRPMPQQEWLT